VSFRDKAIIIGGLVGAVLGATAAWAYTKAQESKLPESEQTPGQLQFQAGAGDYVKIAVTLVALVREVVGLLKPA
jgi:hypothetical protein